MQQVNLYLPEFRQTRVQLAAQQQLTLLAGLLFVLIAVGGFMQSRFNDLDARVKTLRAEVEAQQTATQALTERIDAIKPSEELKQENAQLRRSVNNTRNLVDALLARTDEDQTSGFSPLMEGLARQQTDGLWLTNILLLNAGSQIGVTGATTNPQLVPVYLQKLRNEGRFVGRRFDLFDIRQDEADSRILQFEVSSQNARVPEATP